jgi:2,4-dienoyl-CoA reductase-like NADH-dependent reductase (Old Yellow Enzyme family)
MQTSATATSAKATMFDPIKINGLELKNRIFKAPTLECMAAADGAPTKQLTRFYKRVAKGGSGLMITGISYVSDAGKAYFSENGIHEDRLVPLWKDFTDEIHEAGGKIVMQISHGGRQVDPRLLGSKKAKAPSNVPNVMYCYRAEKLSGDEILQIIKDFGEAAGRAREAGFDGVQIHSSGGYLLASFLSPVTNRRKDEWGGDEKNRFRLFEEIYKTVRHTVGDDFPVLAKIHLGDMLVMGYPYPSNYQSALWMQELGVDALEFAVGVFENATATFARGKMPVSMAGEHIRWPMRAYWKTTEWMYKPLSGVKKPYFQKAAWQLKKRGLTIPLLLAGGVRRRNDIARLLSEGAADLVGMGRPLLKEPNLPNRWAMGDEADSSCLSCNQCTIDIGINANPLKCHHPKK